MHQNNFLFVTGFSSKPEILQRNHSFLNDPKQSGSHDINQNKKPKTDFVQKNKIIIKIQKIQNQQQNGEQNMEPNPLKNAQIKIKKSQFSKKLNQSVGLDDSRENCSDIVKLSQSFDCKLGQAKKILRRIIPKDQQYQNRPFSTMERYVEESNENQTKFRTNFIKFEQDKENQDMNQNFQLQNETNIKDSTCSKSDNLNQNKNSEHGMSSSTKSDQNQKKYGIKCATQPDLDNSIVENNQLLDMVDLNDINLQNNRLKAQLNNQILTNYIVKDSYFNQDKKRDNLQPKNLKTSVIEAKKKFINVRNIVNQSLGEPTLDISDETQKIQGNNKNFKILRKSNQHEQNLIDQYDMNSNNNYIKLQQTQNQLNASKNKKDTDSYSTLTFNQKSTVDQTSPSQQNTKQIYQSQQNNAQQNRSTVNNQETRINQMQEQNIKINGLNQSYNQQLSENIQSNQQDIPESQTQNSQTVSQINNSQIDNNEQQFYQQEANIFKHQQRVIHKSYDYQLGVKNFANQNPLYQSNFENEQQLIGSYPQQNLLTESNHNQPITEKFNNQNSKNHGLMKQNLILFQNNKKQETLKNNIANQNCSQISSQFQMELVSDQGFKPQQYGKSPFKQNTKQIIINPNLQKKFNFNQQQVQQNQQQLMNAYIDMNYRANTEPVSQQNSINQYTPLSLQKKINTQSNINNKSKQNADGHFNNFLEDFNLDSISINANQPLTKSSQKSRKTVNQVQYHFEINSQSGVTPLSLQNKSNAALKNTIRGQSYSQQNQYNTNNIYQNNQQIQKYVKSASSLGFNEADQKSNYNIISHPPLLSQSQDNISDSSLLSNNYVPFPMQGNQIFNSNSTQSRKSGGTGGQNLIFQFHEVNQHQNNQRSQSQNANRNHEMNFNLSIDRTSQISGSQRSQSNHNNLNQFQNFKPQSLNFAPPSCSSIQSLYSSKCQNQLQSKYCNSNTINSSKNLIGDFNQNTMMKEMYTELDEDVRIFDCSPKRIMQLKQNNLQRSSVTLSQSQLDFSNTNNLTSTSSKFGLNNQNQQNDLKQFNETAKVFISKLDNTNKASETNQLIEQYLNQVRNRITQLKNKKKNTEIDLILVNTKIIQEIEQTNTNQKQKMPHNLSQQLDEIYQQIKKNIFIYSCQ
ncbi:endo-1,4-beta-xylanase xylA, putative (macronuclear) [Tetrahymena thermophila SB210]|uniref:Endo-1,4-beta-xylanase xylA, putative n=1 Tax=Tetrahymena thermophila (strain SB210) TaxID=312017 RepID=I7M0V0_TETTS|nr:endo-1,4-beta-xylanase xylA, putative [Tetrahymena thermophila SB210]EAR90986.1 endo-1,4-beta-xylanase xylA, putative [Tetrahymena thermophila SB210]|eukprot:XP_001011231.1 endo-1,4-beta-xylanase xylA, putative [Tetrahymena thermophila SB210]